MINISHTHWIMTLLIGAALFAGCGTTAPQPNQAQKWGTWSYVPGTTAYRARIAEKKEDKVEEAKKQLTRATEELVIEAQKDVRTNVALVTAGIVAKQNTQIHGLPDKPIDTAQLVSTNTIVRDQSFEDLLTQFGKQKEELAYIRKAFAVEREKGEESIKQDSTAGSTWWKFKQWALMFFLRNWWVILLGWLALWQAVKVLAKIYCPPLSMGLNVVEGVASSAVREGFTQTIYAGERFKSGLNMIVDDPALVSKIKEHFRISQERSQDVSTQDLIKKLTAKA